MGVGNLVLDLLYIQPGLLDVQFQQRVNASLQLFQTQVGQGQLLLQDLTSYGAAAVARQRIIVAGLGHRQRFLGKFYPLFILSAQLFRFPVAIARFLQLVLGVRQPLLGVFQLNLG